MNIKEIRLGHGEQLKLVDSSPPVEGNDKFVYKMTDGNKIYAAKIFRETENQNGYEYINPRTSRVLNAIEDQLRFEPTALGIYIPKFHNQLVDEKGELVGMATEWEDGIPANDVNFHRHTVSITEKEFEELEAAIESTISAGFQPSADMFGGQNIHIGPNRVPRLWLAEADANNLQSDFWYRETLEQHLRNTKSWIRRFIEFN